MFFSKKTMHSSRSLGSLLLLIFIGPFTSQSFAQDDTMTKQAPTAQQLSFSSFSTLRSHLLTVIGSAKERVWVSSDFLSDGDIVSALYIAKYRKVDVRVLLGRSKANSYMSRLRYLKTQKIPVFLRPYNFPKSYATVIIHDQKISFINGALDFFAKKSSFQETTTNISEHRNYEKSFTDAFNLKIKAYARPIQKVGRPTPRYKNPHIYRKSNKPKKVYRPPQRRLHIPGRTATARKARKKEDTYNTYYYKGRSQKKPADISGRLPKKTKWQLQLDNNFNNTKNSDATVAPLTK